MSRYLILILMFCSLTTVAQDTLVLKNGRRIAFLKMREYSDGIELKLAEDKTLVLHHPDSILGYWNNSKEVSRFLLVDPAGENEFDYCFTERESFGTISLFTSKESGMKMFAIKGNKLVKVWDSYDPKELTEQRRNDFASLLYDDDESTRYVDDVFYRHSPKEILKVLKHYNLRNFTEPDQRFSNVKGKVYVYRTRFQKTKDRIRINNNGNISELYINDFVVLELPIMQPVKLKFYDSEIRSDLLMAGEMANQYYEVLYDKKSQGFRLDRKSGTELHYEFYGIRDKVDKKFKEKD